MKKEEWLAGHSSFVVKHQLKDELFFKNNEYLLNLHYNILTRRFYMKKSIKETVREGIEPTVKELGYRIWDITYNKIGADYHLEITIDSDDGIEISDCEKVHRAIDPILDEIDPIEGFYNLEVSSPGVERELRTDEHISLSLGEKAEVKLFAPKDGIKSVVGILSSFEDGVVTVDCEGQEYSFAKSDISKIKTIYFDN